MSRPSTGARGLTAQGGAPPTASRAPTAGRVGSRAGSGRVRRRGLGFTRHGASAGGEGGHHPSPQTGLWPGRPSPGAPEPLLCPGTAPPPPVPGRPGPSGLPAGRRGAGCHAPGPADRFPLSAARAGGDWPGLGCDGKEGDRGGKGLESPPAPLPPCPWAGALTDGPGLLGNRGPPRRKRRWRRSRRR